MVLVVGRIPYQGQDKKYMSTLFGACICALIGLVHKLAQQVHCIIDVLSCNCKVYQFSHQLLIFSRIR